MSWIEDAFDVATAAALAAGDVLKQGFGNVREIRHKGRIDLVTEMDKQSEQAIVGILLERFPQHQILAEEGTTGGDNPAFKWIIDPLDGTTNYAHGNPHFGVSIALEAHGEIVVGVVYDPMLDEMFAACKGQGAKLNGQPIQVSTTATLLHSLLGTGFPYDAELFPPALAIWSAFIQKAQAVRRAGAAALDMCYVAAGRFDGFWERPLFEWDMAAGFLLIKEAGGVLTDAAGGPPSIYKREVVASNGLIHKEMLRVIEEADRQGLL